MKISSESGKSLLLPLKRWSKLNGQARVKCLRWRDDDEDFTQYRIRCVAIVREEARIQSSSQLHHHRRREVTHSCVVLLFVCRKSPKSRMLSFLWEIFFVFSEHIADAFARWFMTISLFVFPPNLSSLCSEFALVEFMCKCQMPFNEQKSEFWTV